MRTAISLFSGAGGMDVGFKAAGYDVILANEIDKNAASTFVANHPTTKMIVGDINNYLVEFENIKNVDMVFGGPPCQGFSVIGKMNPDDKRSQLIWSFLKVVELTHPNVFVMENVKALVSIKKWESVKRAFISKAEALGYCCIPFILNAVEYGVPQKRERVFFVGVKGHKNFENTINNNLEGLKCEAPTVRQVFSDLGPAGAKRNPQTCTAKITYAVKPVMRKNPYDCLMFNGIGRPINPDGYSRTITASMGGNMTLIVDDVFLHDINSDNWVQTYFDKLVNQTIIPEFNEAPKRLRRLTINEVKRLQTFPDEYKFIGAKTSVYRQLGNAVPCKMAEAIAKAVKNYSDIVFPQR